MSAKASTARVWSTRSRRRASGSAICQAAAVGGGLGEGDPALEGPGGGGVEAEADQVLGPGPGAREHGVGELGRGGDDLGGDHGGEREVADAEHGEAGGGVVLADLLHEQFAGGVGVEVADGEREGVADLGHDEAAGGELAEDQERRMLALRGGLVAEDEVVEAVAVEVAGAHPAEHADVLRAVDGGEGGEEDGDQSVALAADDVDAGRLAVGLAGGEGGAALGAVVLADGEQGAAVGAAQGGQLAHVAEAPAGGDLELVVGAGGEDADLVGAPGADGDGELVAAVAVEVAGAEGVDVAADLVGAAVGGAALPGAHEVRLEAVELAGVGAGADVELAQAVAVEVGGGDGRARVVLPAVDEARAGGAELEQLDLAVAVTDEVGGLSGAAVEQAVGVQAVLDGEVGGVAGDRREGGVHGVHGDRVAGDAGGEGDDLVAAVALEVDGVDAAGGEGRGAGVLQVLQEGDEGQALGVGVMVGELREGAGEVALGEGGVAAQAGPLGDGEGARPALAGVAGEGGELVEAPVGAEQAGDAEEDRGLAGVGVGEAGVRLDDGGEGRVALTGGLHAIGPQQPGVARGA